MLLRGIRRKREVSYIESEEFIMYKVHNIIYTYFGMLMKI